MHGAFLAALDTLSSVASSGLDYCGKRFISIGAEMVKSKDAAEIEEWRRESEPVEVDWHVVKGKNPNEAFAVSEGRKKNRDEGGDHPTARQIREEIECGRAGTAKRKARGQQEPVERSTAPDLGTWPKNQTIRATDDSSPSTPRGLKKSKQDPESQEGVEQQENTIAMQQAKSILTAINKKRDTARHTPISEITIHFTDAAVAVLLFDNDLRNKQESRPLASSPASQK
ncbi:hypothetical protein CC80DRAFT_543025 [Byssothecium circinans]|uniref:Uncharacterized protein n=1 Tax=Byssothecium circinans TaxID=147558 RepID=A0A6A5UD57_9PLEO|nr:hypothetical protein CC80DRAFT_543025 [Byssothecium circinans]